MLHGYMYQGGFERNFPALAPGTTDYRTHAGAVVPIPTWPSDVDGVRVGYMERRGKKFFAVRLQFEEHDVVLGTPVAIDPMRHMGNQRFSADPTIVPDDLASALLDDVIEANPAQTNELALLLNGVNAVRRGERERSLPRDRSAD